MKRNGMKTRFCGIILLLLALAAVCFAGAEGNPGTEMYYTPHTGSSVAAVFAAPDIQPYTDEDGETDRIDSVWVYYSDGTFEQFAVLDDR